MEAEACLMKLKENSRGKEGEPTGERMKKKERTLKDGGKVPLPSGPIEKIQKEGFCASFRPSEIF